MSQLRVDPKTPKCVVKITMDPKSNTFEAEVTGIRGYRPSLLRLGLKKAKKELSRLRTVEHMKERSIEDTKDRPAVRSVEAPKQDRVTQEAIAVEGSAAAGVVREKLSLKRPSNTLAAKVRDIEALENKTLSAIAEKKAHA